MAAIILIHPPITASFVEIILKLKFLIYRTYSDRYNIFKRKFPSQVEVQYSKLGTQMLSYFIYAYFIHASQVKVSRF
jgi:hypothetical protein